jgi:hypothetical protein
MFKSGRIFVRVDRSRRFFVQVLEHVYPNVVILELTERLTLETEVDLRDAVRRQLDAGRRHIVLDLARAPYVDSCGLARWFRPTCRPTARAGP